MKDIIPQLRSWEEQRKRYALATLIKVDRSAPKPPGAAMAVCEDGTVVGSVSGGCVESALHEEAVAVLASGVPKTVSYGITDAEGFEIGLACGGQLHLFVDEPSFPQGLFDAIQGSKPVALTTVIGGPAMGQRHAVGAGSSALTESGSAGAAPEGHVTRMIKDAGDLLRRGIATEVRSYDDAEVFIQTFGPAAEMYVFGAADFSAAVASMGKFLGFHVTVIDPRAAFATRERFPDADEVVVEWPDKFLAKAPVGPSTALVILTHDPKFDIPALTYALKTDAGYIGAMGAKRTNEERSRKLREAGCSDEQLARIHAPIGLDLGGQSPHETAVSIAAQIVGLRNGKLAH